MKMAEGFVDSDGREDGVAKHVTIACSLDDRELAARSAMYRESLFAGILERQERPGGYAFRFASDPDWRARIEAFADAERRCCAFLDIEVSDDEHALWLTLTGPEGTKAFIREVFDDRSGA